MAFLRRIGLVATVVAALVAWPGAWQCAWAEGAGGPAKESPRSAWDPAAFRVGVAVGHTAESPGCPSARGFWEYDFNLRLATLVKQKLLAAGFGKTVLLVTDGRPGKACSSAWGGPIGCRPTSSSRSITIRCRTRFWKDGSTKARST